MLIHNAGIITRSSSVLCCFGNDLDQPSTRNVLQISRTIATSSRVSCLNFGIAIVKWSLSGRSNHQVTMRGQGKDTCDKNTIKTHSITYARAEHHTNLYSNVPHRWLLLNYLPNIKAPSNMPELELYPAICQHSTVVVHLFHICFTSHSLPSEAYHFLT